MRNEIRIKEVMGCAASALGEEYDVMSYNNNERRNSEPNCAPRYEEGVVVGKLSRALNFSASQKYVMEPRTYGRIPIGAGLQPIPSANAAPKRQGGISTPVV